MYFHKSPRVYILTRLEQKLQLATCPKCGKSLVLLPFTKQDKLYRCDDCNFHIPKSYVVLERVAGINFDNRNRDNGGFKKMDINKTLIRIAKDLTAGFVTKDQAYSYIVLHGGFRQSELSVQPKDRMRVVDMNSKASKTGRMDMNKYKSLVSVMANSIKDAEKAYRRGLAVLSYADLSDQEKKQMASIFFEKAVALG